MSKILSAGVLILNSQREILLAHATGMAHWDIPKGRLNPGEDTLSAALRETFEETGISLQAEKVTDLGRMAYNREKDLHLYYVVVPRESVNIAECICSSYFTQQHTGLSLPEMDNFKWVPFSGILSHCSPTMGKRLNGLPLSEYVQDSTTESATPL